MSYKTILIDDNPPIRTITLNRPERRNAMTAEMQTELIEAFEQISAGPTRVLILAGVGEAFCSGLDLSELQAMHSKTPADHRADAERIARLFITLRELPIPTIAAVHGPAIAGGTGLAMNCDFTLATPPSKFGFTEVRIGFVPALVSAFLSLQVGEKRARDLLLTGRLFDAAEAHQLGLVNEVVAHAELMTRAQSLAQTLLANSPESLSATKRLLVEQSRSWLDAAVAAALEANVASRETSDFREGIAAFLEKRKPVWSKTHP
ncbi:enoyl-CoA hydratase/isomerase family protein [Occallatibacter savannae]|uniref:enoyl-CoA hydratase/isomerase family protein n=1 Tax=Occallatibacter savannae TaxID=1002691 RepID=UPI000D695097|nr:enoyl-CoA hydratase-related protein [Occallatibacter savannae]